jgi:hypothetical protein
MLALIVVLGLIALELTIALVTRISSLLTSLIAGGI